MGFEGFLDEGLEAGVRAPTHIQHTTNKHHHTHQHHKASAKHSAPHHNQHRTSSDAKSHSSHHASHKKPHSSHHSTHHHHHLANNINSDAFLSFLELPQQDPTINTLRGVPRAHPSRQAGVSGAAPLPPTSGINQYSTPPATVQQNGNLPVMSAAFGKYDMQPSTYAANPSYPQHPLPPSNPEGELSWMLESDRSKGYGEEKPEKLSLDRALQSLKGFIKKGAKMTEQSQAVDVSATVAETPNDGFGGWPQPFWWTRPPQWLDEIPGWMQRYELKKSSSLHKAAAFG